MWERELLMAGEVVSIIVTKHLKMRLFFPPFPRVMCLHSFSSLFVAQVFVKYGHRDTTTGPSSFSLFWHKEDLTRAHKDGRMKKKTYINIQSNDCGRIATRRPSWKQFTNNSTSSVYLEIVL